MRLTHNLLQILGNQQPASSHMAWSIQTMRQNLILNAHLLYFLLFCFSQNSKAIQLNRNGGYDIVVAVKAGDTTPDEALYVENIKKSFQSMSKEMWVATEGKFFINSLEILLPTDWMNVNLTQVEPSIQTYTTADIRISNDVKYPNVKNPTICQSGDHVDLPNNFFLSPISSEYGFNSKTLLVLWARYRWGVWEEYGYPGDETFPYFYQNQTQALLTEALQSPPQQKENIFHWLTTGCPATNDEGTDDEVVGIYGNLNKTSPHPCNPLMSPEMEETCRFFPNTTATSVTTSLMQFHWLSSVTKFCNSTNHNKAAPNRQNYFCVYKSAMETIEGSTDHQKLLGPSTLDPTIGSIKVVKAGQKPVLYVLVDHGRMHNNDALPIVEKVKQSLITLLRSRIDQDILTSIGYYPTNSTNKNLMQVMPWKILEGNGGDVLTSLNLATQFDDFVYNRDFTWPIKQAVVEILTQPLGQVNGGVILLFKTLTDPGYPTYDTFQGYEIELEDLMVRGNVRLFCVEIILPQSISNPVWTGNMNQLAGRTGGVNLELGKEGAVDEEETLELENFVQKIVDFYSAPPPSIRREETKMAEADKSLDRIIWRGRPTVYDTIEIPLYPSATSVNVHFYARYNLNETTDLTAQVEGIDGSGSGSGESIAFVKTPRWTNEVPPENVGSLSRGFLYQGELDLITLRENDEVNDLTLTFNHSDENRDHYLIVTVRGDELPEPYKILVTTTAIDGHVDFSTVPDYSPFVIYAEVTQGGHPVLGLDVHAMATRVDNNCCSESESTHMSDDGFGYPDMVAGDGIYSAFSFPQFDATYRYSIRIKYSKTTATNKFSKNGGLTPNTNLLPLSSTHTSPLPIDQVDVGQGICGPDNENEDGCGGGPVGPLEIWDQETFLPIITFENLNRLKLNYPYQIRDLTVIESHGKENDWTSKVSLNMTAPTIFLRYSTGILAANLYDVYSSPNHDSLTNLRPSNKAPLPIDVQLAYHTYSKSDPGDAVIVNFDVDWNTTFLYFTVLTFTETHYSDSTTIRYYSPPSNIAVARRPTQPIDDGGEDTTPWIRSVGGIATIVGGFVLIILTFFLVGILYYRVKRGKQREATAAAPEVVETSSMAV